MTGKRALVTGGSGDIGGATCKALAASGHHVIVHANRNRARADALVDEILSAGGSAEAVAFDITDATATRAAIDKLLADGSIQILINNAGIHDDAPLAGMTDTQWRGVIDVSLNGFFHATQPLLLPMARKRWGRIVSVSSVAAVTGNRGQTNYAASKAGAASLTKTLGEAWARDGIRVVDYRDDATAVLTATADGGGAAAPARRRPCAGCNGRSPCNRPQGPSRFRASP